MLRHGWGNKRNQVRTGTNTRSRKYSPCKTTRADSRYLNMLLDNYLNGMLLYRQQHRFSPHSPQSGSYFSSIKNTKLSPITLGKQFFPTVSNLEILKNANTFPRKGGGLGWRKTTDTETDTDNSVFILMCTESGRYLLRPLKHCPTGGAPTHLCKVVEVGHLREGNQKTRL